MFEQGLATPALARNRAAVIVLGSLAIGYVLLSIGYFYADFFRFLSPGTPIIVDSAGVAIPVSDGCYYLWTFLSPWRLALASAAVVMIAISALALYRGHPRARMLALISLWGLLLPQMFWYTEFALDWHGGHGLLGVALAFALAVGLPTALLFEGHETLAGWGLQSERGRLFATTVVLAWIGFGASEVLDHSYRTHSVAAFVAAFAVLPLTGIALAGMMRLRTWALWAGMAAAVLFGSVALTFSPTWYFGGAGYLDAAMVITLSSTVRRIVAAMIPATVVWLAAAPFFRSFVRRVLFNRV
jgi:hypothetical protein